MNYAIIAAGEGSRLAQEGYPLPKPMVSLNGEMLIDRLIGIFMRNKAKSIQIIIREDAGPLNSHLVELSHTLPIKLTRQSTPSSLHSFKALLETMGDNDSLCLTTTDSIFRKQEFNTFIAAFHRNPHLDGLMAVTSFVDDESPLFVTVDEHRTITAFTDENTTHTPFVSGGLYCFRKKALDCVAQTVADGVSRMRNFQRQLLENQLVLQAYPFSKIVDIDHVRDIRTAELFLRQRTRIAV